MDLAKKIQIAQLKKMYRQMDSLNYDALLDGLELLKIELAEEEDARLYVAAAAIKKCILSLKEIFDNESEDE